MFPEAHGSSIGTIYIQNTESPRHRTLSGGPPPFGKGAFRRWLVCFSSKGPLAKGGWHLRSK